MKVPSPSQIRDSRVKHLVSIAESILEGGASQHLLFDRLLEISFRLWPTLRDKTRREYAVAATKIVLSRLHSEPVLHELRGAPPQEAK